MEKAGESLLVSERTEERRKCRDHPAIWGCDISSLCHERTVEVMPVPLSEVYPLLSLRGIDPLRRSRNSTVLRSDCGPVSPRNSDTSSSLITLDLGKRNSGIGSSICRERERVRVPLHELRPRQQSIVPRSGPWYFPQTLLHGLPPYPTATGCLNERR